MWGLTHYLITEKGYGVKQVQDAAVQWLRFIHPDYYVMQELKAKGIDPSDYGLVYESPCYAGKCELPFRQGGCGGMRELKL